MKERDASQIIPLHKFRSPHSPFTIALDRIVNSGMSGDNKSEWTRRINNLPEFSALHNASYVSFDGEEFFKSLEETSWDLKTKMRVESLYWEKLCEHLDSLRELYQTTLAKVQGPNVRDFLPADREYLDELRLR